MSLAFKPAVSYMSSSESDQPEIEWMRRIKEGDMDAFRLLVEAHQARVIGTISKMLASDTEAEDLAQQVFIRVWKSAQRYTTKAKFTTWLFRITRNLVFNEMRRRKHFAEPTDDLSAPAERTAQ